MLNMLKMKTLCLAALLCVAGLTVSVEESFAGDEARITVDVVSGKKGASGIDSSAKKHERLLSRLGGYGGWKLTTTFTLKVSPGQTAKQAVGNRSFSAKLHTIKGGKARTTFVLVDPAGQDHKVTSQLANGASTAITAESSNGKGVQVFIIKIRY